ncbi:MAG: hypothetical protein CMN79_04675 [Spirochaetales bacterium]|nr:hypothetical protein [Spirochaetales bacterium]
MGQLVEIASVRGLPGPNLIILSVKILFVIKSGYLIILRSDLTGNSMGNMSQITAIIGVKIP